MHHELVLIDQSSSVNADGSFARPAQFLARLPLELLNGLAEIPAHDFRVRIDR